MSPIEGPLVGSVSAADATEALAGPDASSSSASAAPATTGGGGGARPPKWKGRILKRFKLVDLLGQGAMGKVFRAEDVTLATHNALLQMIDHLQTRGWSRQQAYAICSVAVDLRVSQVVDVAHFLVTAFLPEDIFTG